MRFLLLILCCTLYASAQKKLSLAEAWQLAEQNPQVLQKAEEVARAGVDQVKRLKLPVINFQYQSPPNLGRRIDPYTNSSDTRTLLSNTHNISAGYTLFDNGQIKNQIKAAENYQKALGMEIAVTENDLKYRVLLAYTEVLLSREQIKMLEIQVATTEENRAYLDKLYKAERVRYALLLTMEIEQERLKMELRGARAEHDAARIKLKRLINTEAEPQHIEVSPVRYPFSAGQITAAAYGQLPELKTFHYYLRQKRDEERLFFAQRLPVISAFSNVGTTYSSAAMEVSNNELRKMGYFNQFGNNLNISLGIGVSVPVFNSVNFREKLQRNAIEQKILWYRENDRKQEIKSIVEEALTRIYGLTDQYAFSKKRIASLEELVQISRRSFEEGRGEFTEFLQARRDMEQAQAQQNRLKYQYLLYFKQLEFYRKGIWE